MKKHFKTIAIVLSIFLAPSILYAACDVQEVIEMVDEDMSTRMIKDACSNNVDVPDCTISKVIRLARKGTSEDEIYSVCEDEPKSNSESPELERNSGLPRGSVVRACGCWGYVNIGAVDVVRECSSGYGVAVACAAYCPAGGYQWGIQCQ